ncbi:MAG: patatin [Oxalobacter sp.]|nr:MAG: patatin [Oxalobacter sp.]
MTYHFRNLVFEGGGVKGVAYLGVLEVLEARGIPANIERIGGASVGAINAVLLGLGYSLSETRQILMDLDFRKFMDESWGIPGGIVRMFRKYGWYKGDYFRQWIGKRIKEKTGDSESTFGDIEKMKQRKEFKSLYFIGTNLSTEFSDVFSAEHTPDMCVADAVRMSMSLPLFFTAKRGQNRDVYVDGGTLDNYPVKLFDQKKYLSTNNFRETDYYQRLNASFRKNKRPEVEYVYNQETLGFRLDTKEEINVFRDHQDPQHKRIDNLRDYIQALVSTVIDAQQDYHLHSDDWQRTVYVDTLGVKTTDFDLSDQKKKELVQSGRDGALAYFKWYDDPTAKANK